MTYPYTIFGRDWTWSIWLYCKHKLIHGKIHQTDAWWRVEITRIWSDLGVPSSQNKAIPDACHCLRPLDSIQFQVPPGYGSKEAPGPMFGRKRSYFWKPYVHFQWSHDVPWVLIPAWFGQNKLGWVAALTPIGSDYIRLPDPSWTVQKQPVCSNFCMICILRCHTPTNGQGWPRSWCSDHVCSPMLPLWSPYGPLGVRGLHRCIPPCRKTCLPRPTSRAWTTDPGSRLYREPQGTWKLSWVEKWQGDFPTLTIWLFNIAMENTL